MVSNDPVLKFVVGRASREPAIRKVILFGSRARGDQKPESDYDLAFEVHPKGWPGWGRFSDDLTHNNPSIHSLDLVHLGDCSDELANRAQEEGKVIYESR